MNYIISDNKQEEQKRELEEEFQKWTVRFDYLRLSLNNSSDQNRFFFSLQG